MKIPFFSCLFLLPICSPFVNFGIYVVSGQCLHDQRDLLIGLKTSLIFNNNSSKKLVHWNESPNCCLWEGVTCSEEGCVIGLNLFNESISGGLDNSSLFSLLDLESLNLAYNNFSNSEIPQEFGNLTNLSCLNLSNAGFAGQIPSEISNLNRLVTLDLSTDSFLSNSMLKIEKPNLATLVQNFGELKELYLDGVNISAPGNEWCQALSSSLWNLRVLSMSQCYLSGPFDSSLSELRSLSIIRLHGNPLNTPVPEFFANFVNLTSLNLVYCGLKGTFPESVFQILTLQKLDLLNNELLQGALPDAIGNLTMLSRLDLSNCNFSGSIPNSMANLVQLAYLDMSFNSFTGPIPSFSMAKNLTQIYLSHNKLTGKITSTHWNELPNLVNLHLGFNSLGGSIPVSLFSLPLLQKLELSDNQFSGQLNYFSVSSYLLDTLDLSSNNLEGPIPMSVFELQGLKFLSLSSNNFSGSLQLNKIQQLRNLSYLDLSYNSLLIEYNGTNSSSSSFPQLSKLKLASCNLKTFPDFLRNQSKLSFLDLSINQIPGEIPNWNWNLTNLLYLNLSYNHLEGPLLNLPTALIVLDLHSNQLQGPLPALLASAAYLDFSRNNFSSVIHDGIGSNLTFASFLFLSNNKLSGSIPESICSATYLLVLDLSNNLLSGTTPQCFYEMSETLMVLDVRRNQLSGYIYDSFSVNCSLQTLSLNGNLLEGVVPKSLGNCKYLEVLDLGNNKIKDAFPCNLRKISSLHVLILRSNKFYGSIDCGGPNNTWPMLQIIDLASNSFTGWLPRKSLYAWKAMIAQSQFEYLQIRILQFSEIDYQNAITVTGKGLDMELVKIATLFTSIDLSCNNLDGPIPEELGALKSLLFLNLSHNALTGHIPPILGNLSQLESLDLSSNKLTGDIPMQFADSLTFLAFLNLSFNQLVGPIPFFKQFATFSGTSYEGNEGLCGNPLNKNCALVPRSPPPTFQETHSNSGEIHLNFVSVELGFIFGFGIVIVPLMFWKRWSRWYFTHVDDILIRIFPQLNLGIKYRGRRARINQGQRH
ncbi:receptor-like protein 7 [Quercus lobata]|uniref:Leucine-rich repeat-containing N-terminal plant-type domain-containing protein n=1 Tax=Quercus lobata TaxID=97700 RepID=A0A7N2M418_QUELO|nr:receptor-like protein 7 [Quercus lobata]